MWQGNEKHKEQLLQCQQHTERLGAMLSARSWDTMRVFIPLVRCFLCSLCIKAVTGCFSCADCLRQVTKLRRREEMPPQTRVNVNSIHLFLVYLCQRVRQGEWIKAHIKTSPVVSVVAVESGHELGINHNPSLSLLHCSSQTEFCIHKQKLDMALINERHSVKAAHSWRDEEDPLLHWHQQALGGQHSKTQLLNT